MFYQLIEGFIRNFGGVLGRKIRYAYYKRRLGACGKNVIIDAGVVFSSPKNIFLGDNIWIDQYSILIAGPFNRDRAHIEKENPQYSYNTGELHIEKGVHIPPFCVLQAHAGIWIKENAGFGAGAKVYSLSHHHSNLMDRSDEKRYALTSMAPKDEQFLIAGPIVIGQKAAIGMNSVVLPGTNIPDGTWLGVNTFMYGQDLLQNTIYSAPRASTSSGQ